MSTTQPTDRTDHWWSSAHEHSRRCWWDQEQCRWVCPSNASHDN